MKECYDFLVEKKKFILDNIQHNIHLKKILLASASQYYTPAMEQQFFEPLTVKPDETMFMNHGLSWNSQSKDDILSISSSDDDDEDEQEEIELFSESSHDDDNYDDDIEIHKTFKVSNTINVTDNPPLYLHENYNNDKTLTKRLLAEHSSPLSKPHAYLCELKLIKNDDNNDLQPFCLQCTLHDEDINDEQKFKRKIDEWVDGIVTNYLYNQHPIILKGVPLADKQNRPLMFYIAGGEPIIFNYGVDKEDGFTKHPLPHSNRTYINDTLLRKVIKDNLTSNPIIIIKEEYSLFSIDADGDNDSNVYELMIRLNQESSGLYALPVNLEEVSKV